MSLHSAVLISKWRDCHAEHKIMAAAQREWPQGDWFGNVSSCFNFRFSFFTISCTVNTAFRNLTATKMFWRRKWLKYRQKTV